MFSRLTSIRASAIALIGAFVLAACATQGPDIRVNSAPDAALSSYGTFGFPEQTGTDRGGYSTIVTNYFKAAVRDQMQLRGYQYVDENPDLLINFYANVRERTEVRSRPGSSVGYYGYRYGLYDAWPLYNNDVETVTYPIGTANIDVVDHKRKQLIWEGVAEGRIRDADMDQPQQTIARVVGQLFERFPGRATAVEKSAAADQP
jgi:Domain of unknown function (DUF4136)